MYDIAKIVRTIYQDINTTIFYVELFCTEFIKLSWLIYEASLYLKGTIVCDYIENISRCKTDILS